MSVKLPADVTTSAAGGSGKSNLAYGKVTPDSMGHFNQPGSPMGPGESRDHAPITGYNGARNMPTAGQKASKMGTKRARRRG